MDLAPPEVVTEMREGRYGTDARDDLWSLDRLEKVVLAQREKSHTLVEMAELSKYFFVEEIEMDPKSAEKFLTVETKPVLERLVSLLEELPAFDHEALEKVFHQVMEETGLKMGKVAQPVRVAITGGTVSPGIYETLDILGKETSLKRMRDGNRAYCGEINVRRAKKRSGMFICTVVSCIDDGAASNAAPLR